MASDGDTQKKDALAATLGYCQEQLDSAQRVYGRGWRWGDGILAQAPIWTLDARPGDRGKRLGLGELFGIEQLLETFLLNTGVSKTTVAYQVSEAPGRAVDDTLK